MFAAFATAAAAITTALLAAAGSFHADVGPAGGNVSADGGASFDTPTLPLPADIPAHADVDAEAGVSTGPVPLDALPAGYSLQDPGLGVPPTHLVRGLV